MKRLRERDPGAASLFPACLVAACLVSAGLVAGCSSTAEDGTPSVDLSSYELAEFTVPDRLPEADAPLGVLRPDARKTRDDITITTKFYEIEGSTPSELLNGETGMLAGAKGAGLAFLARTDWGVNWRYDLEETDGTCRVESVTTRLRVTYQLPDWEPDDDAPQALRDLWSAFERDLWIHEYGHGLVGYRAKQDIQKILSEADISHPDCRVVGDRLNALGRAITSRGQDAAYDELTGNGRTQGAVFGAKATGSE